jgi:hypothetical protein
MWLTSAPAQPGRPPRTGDRREAVFRHGPRPTWLQVEALLSGSDREELRLTSLSSPQVFSEPLTEVLRVVLRCWPAVGQLATRLVCDGPVGHADVCAALGLTDDGEPGSVALAMIRSGSAPGTFTVTRAALQARHFNSHDECERPSQLNLEPDVRAPAPTQ